MASFTAVFTGSSPSSPNMCLRQAATISSFGFVLLNQGKLEHRLRGCHKNVTGCGKKVKVGGEGEANLHLNYQDRLFLCQKCQKY